MRSFDSCRLAVLLFSGALTVSVDAATVAYDVAAPSTGSQEFGGSLGLDFDVNSAILVTDIGVFDSDQDGMKLDIFAQLWTRDGDSGTLIAGTETIFAAGDPGTLMNGNRFKPLASPVVLDPGSYTINAFGYGAGEPNGNTDGPLDKTTDDGGGLITFVGGGRFGDAAVAGDFPNSPDGGPENRYAAGTFIFQQVPEPEAFGLLLLGCVCLLGLRRRLAK